MTGINFRWWRDHAAELGVEILRIDGKSVILADQLLAALERRAQPMAAPDEHEPPEDEIAAFRRRIAAAG